MLMFIIMLIVIFPILNFTLEIYLWILIIAVIKITSIAIGYIKFHEFSPVHNYLNKFTGLLLVLLPVFLLLIPSTTVIYIICIVATIASIDEIAIIISSKNLDLNRKIFFIKNQ